MLIRLQRIYNLWSIHANILPFLDVLKSFYSKFISFFGTNLLSQCPVPVVVFCLFFTLQEINIKQSPNTAKLFVDFLWTRTLPMGQSCSWGGAPRGAQPTRARQGGPGAPGGLCPPRWLPVPPLCTINSQIAQHVSTRRRLRSRHQPPRCFFGPLLVFWSIKNLREVSLHLDSVWYWFPAM